jgi:hypothetical protein
MLCYVMLCYVMLCYVMLSKQFTFDDLIYFCFDITHNSRSDKTFLNFSGRVISSLLHYVLLYFFLLLGFKSTGNRYNSSDSHDAAVRARVLGS